MSKFFFADVFKQWKGDDSKCNIYLWSDLHMEHKRNRHIVKELKKENIYNKRTDILILGGDLTYHPDRFEDSLELFKEIFDHIFFCPGNSEFRLDWHRKKRRFENSIEKFIWVRNTCEKYGIHYQPTKVSNNLWIFPVHGWYTPTFDSTYQEGDTSYHKKWLDFSTIFFPSSMKSDPDEYFQNLNQKSVNDFLLSSSSFDIEKDQIISFSHFLPRRDLLPWGRLLKPSLPFVTGNPSIDSFIRMKLPKNPIIHCFGHSHVNTDTHIDGIHYIQCALSHPSERKQIWKKFAPIKPKWIHSFPLNEFLLNEKNSMKDEDEGDGEDEKSMFN